MAILTKLSKKDFEKILEKYDLGEYRSSKHVTWALQNTVYFLWTSKAKYILKICEKSDLNYINYQIKIMNFAFKRGLPIAEIMKTKQKKDLYFYKNHRILIQKFVNGKEPKKFTNNLVRDIAKKQSKLNKNLMEIKLTGKYVWKKDFQFKRMDERAGIMGDFDFTKEENYLLKEIRKLNKRKLRKSVVHGDFHSCNLIVDKNKLKAIIDWDDVHEDFLVQEIANFISHSFIKKNEIKRKYLKLYLKEYQKYMKLNEEEKKTLYYFIQNRYLGVIAWNEKQKEQHKDQTKKIDNWNDKMIKSYKTIKNFSLNKFLKLIK